MLRKKLLTLFLVGICATNPLIANDNGASNENLVQLDGSGSQDADGDQLIYSWRQVSGQKVFLINSNTARPSFYAEAAGEYAFELVVSDGRVESEPAIVNVLIEEANEIPVAALPAKIAIELGENAVLDGSNSSDADNDALLYNFKQISGPTQILRSTVSQNPQFTVLPKAVGTYSFELVVNDGRANSDPVVCTLEVIRPNTAPVAKVVAPQKTLIKTKHRFNASTRIQTNPRSTQRIVIPKTNPVNMETINNSNRSHKILKAKVNLPKKSAMPDMIEELETLSTAQPLNITPIASTSGNMEVSPGTKVVIKGFGVDPDGDSLQFIWNQIAGPMIPGSPVMRKNLAFIPRKEGTYIFKLIVNDGKIKSEPATCAITVKNREIASNKVKLNDAEFTEDINSLELSIPSEDDSVAQVANSSDDDDISFRELFSID